MARTLRCCLGAVALTATVAACGDTSDDTTTTTTERSGGGAADLIVEARDDLSFDQESYEIEAGDVDVLYVNEGNVAHTLRIKGVDGFELAVGDEDAGTVTLEPGTYQLYCDVPGHEAAGMAAELTVG